MDYLEKVRYYCYFYLFILKLGNKVLNLLKWCCRGRQVFLLFGWRWGLRAIVDFLNQKDICLYSAPEPYHHLLRTEVVACWLSMTLWDCRRCQCLKCGRLLWKASLLLSGEFGSYLCMGRNYTTGCVEDYWVVEIWVWGEAHLGRGRHGYDLECWFFVYLSIAYR